MDAGDDAAAALGQRELGDPPDFHPPKDDARALLLEPVHVVEADGDVLAALQQAARRPPAYDDHRRDRDRPDPSRPPAPAHGGPRAGDLRLFLLAHRDPGVATSHIRRGSKVKEAIMVSIVMSMNAIAPQSARAEASGPKSMSGT